MIKAQLVQFFFFATQVTLVVSARLGRNWGGDHGGMGHGGMGHGGVDHGDMDQEGMDRGGMDHGGMGNGEMMQMIHNLLDHREDIERNYENTDTGIESWTTSGKPNVALWIQTHVYQMTTLMDSETGGIRLWDDLFERAFALRDNHELMVNNTADGVHVVQKVSDNVVDIDEAECTTELIQEHAEVVSKFVDRGMSEMHANHPAPEKCAVY
eukprot:CAMPEP_0201871694 /NCGR_PEP_ID=MMETSP0902-20130614/4559_1 /ASSEMBLY_ACC=CAM_ASM_000551 /TAXON_ID=420261 /ORGANISM="Thalassiosira antarctica, Strain CCMP982" /LENGTH=210 /DNA_ID=CAMNT_0048397755 /DNA_START=1892 /DNA_END=2524 /DNA_ORIENTATION=+